MQRIQIPAGRYWIGSPDLILDTGEADPIDEIFYKSGLQEKDGHKFVSINTMGDGPFKLYDLEDSMHSGDPEHVDTFITDVATICIIPAVLVPDEDKAEEWARLFSVDVDEEPFSLDITIHYHTYSTGVTVVDEVDIEWYKLLIRDQLKYEEED